MKVAVTGKGGVGKTTIAGALAYILHKRGFRVLAVDADPNANLAYTLGLRADEAERITPISENWDLIEEKTGVRPNSYGMLFRLNFTVDDIVRRYAVRTPCGVDLLVMGVVREALGGCMCPANYLIRMLLRHLIIRRREAVILDMEAGTEHLARGTAKHVGAMIVVAEPSIKAMETARRIRDLASQMGIENILLVGNKVLNEKDEDLIRGFSQRNGIPILGIVHYDPAIREADLSGHSPIVSCPSSRAMREIEAINDRLIKIIKD